MNLHEPLVLASLGFLVGTFGTLIGAGGGFLMVPVLLILYPTLKPETLTGISLTVVFFNALSGSVAYAYKKKIDCRSALHFSIAAAPGSILGAYATTFIPRVRFEFAFGIVMVLVALYLFFSRNEMEEMKGNRMHHPIRTLVDRQGNLYQISYNYKLGMTISGIVGFLSSLLGIGGGIIHVPALVRVLNFPVHIATATSHAILAVMALLGATEHLLKGDLNSARTQILWLVPFVIVGAQLGAHLSHKVHGTWIVRTLAVALLFVGLRFSIF